jgi:proline iminopeptidase
MSTLEKSTVEKSGPHTSPHPGPNGSPDLEQMPGVPSAGNTTVVSKAGAAFGRLFGPLWHDRRIGLASAVGLSTVAGIVTGWWTPRGPMTTGQALAAMAVGAMVGWAAGTAMRSRWSIAVAPTVFVVAFEMTRLGSDGPTVDALRPEGTYGILAMIVGRGFHGLLALVPMMIGATFGAATARFSTGTTPVRHRTAAVGVSLRRAGAAAATLAMVALALGVARPAGTNPIRDDAGKRVPGSIAELTRVKIGGHHLAMMIRGASTKNPIVLYLAGGPGGSEMGAMRNHLESLERDFLVVTWDQRGTGKSYREIEPTATLTFDNAIADTIEVTNYLRQRFGQDKIFLLGQSYGSTLGVRAVQRNPELFRAFIGTGQMVSQRVTDQIFYDDTLAWARKNNNKTLISTLTKLGPPPYRDLMDYQASLGSEHEVYPYDHSRNSEGEGGFSENFLEREYTFVDQVHLLGGFLDTFNFIYPQLQTIDFRTDATSLEVPLYLAQGAHEARGRAELANEWFALVDAPVKKMVTFDTSGHRPLFEQPEEFTKFMVETVLAENR